jgi:hypothetical protein
METRDGICSAPCARSRSRFVLLAALLAGCSSSETTKQPDAGPSPAGVDGAAGSVDSAAGVPPDSASTSAVDPNAKGPGLTGVLTDESGTAIVNVQVLACMASTCLFGRSDPTGRFTFAVDPPASVALKTLEDLTTTPRRGAFLRPVTITNDALVDVGSAHVPNLPSGAPLDLSSNEPKMYAAGDGLTVTLSASDLVPRLGDFLTDVAARRIAPSVAGAIPGLGNERLVAVYALHPFAATSMRPIAVQAPSDLPRGTAVNFRSISEIDGHLSEPAHGLADGSFVNTNVGNGITELTWLVISQ